VKRTTGQATLLAYTGVILLISAYFPGLQQRMASIRFLHALWHVAIFVGAACLVYGLETLRGYARRYRRLTQ
jgi:predicted membrane channel-forming protein YqfA (hemolysin III family)